MNSEWTAIPDAEVPAAAECVWLHLPTTDASETNIIASMWRAVPDERLLNGTREWGTIVPREPRILTRHSERMKNENDKN